MSPSRDWNGFRGKAKPIEDIDLPRVGELIGVGEDEVHALIDVEANGEFFDKQGRPQMLFEPHRFFKELGSGEKRVRAMKQGLAYENWGEQKYPKESYSRLEKAIEIDEKAALRASSWGGTQILGSNHEMIGYDTVQEMVQAFMDDADAHLEGMIQFVKSSGIDDDLREHRWDVVARVYNGPKYAKHGYHTKLAAAYKKWAKIPDTPYEPTKIVANIDADYKNGKVHPQVMAVQMRLDELLYPEVGTVDGKWGGKTEAAILAFRNDNNLPLNTDIDTLLLSSLMTASPRVIAPARANATIEDLKGEGAEDVKSMSVTQVAGGVIGAGGVLSAATEILDTFEGYSGNIRGLVEAVQPFQQFITDNVWMLLIGGGAFVFYQTVILKRIRLEKHQTGQDVSV